MNRIREKFLNHELSVGTFTQLTSTVAVEARAAQGFDSVTAGLDIMALVDSYRAMVQDIRG